MAEIDRLIKADKEKKLIKGFRETLKALKHGRAAEVFAASSCPESMLRELEQIAGLSKIKLTKLQANSEQLSAQLKKPFAITVLAISS